MDQDVRVARQVQDVLVDRRVGRTVRTIRVRVRLRVRAIGNGDAANVQAIPNGLAGMMQLGNGNVGAGDLMLAGFGVPELDDGA